MEVDKVLDVSVDETKVHDGQWVLLIDNETRFQFAVVSTSTFVRLGKKPCACSPLIGAVYGSYFEAINGKLLAMDPNAAKAALEELLGEEEEGTAAPDNRDLHDHNTSQNLSQDDILAMKQAEKSNSEIVKALATNSATWNKRTEFSQEKYIRKKTKKHQVIVQVVKPTSSVIARAYFHKKPARILNMRPDTLAHIVTLGNLQAGLRTLVIDDCNGLVLGTVIEKLNGRGHVFNIHQGNAANPSAVRLFNFNAQQLEPLRYVPIGLLQGKITAQTFKVDESALVDDDDDDMMNEDGRKSNKKKRILKNPGFYDADGKKKNTKEEYQYEAGLTPEQNQERKRQYAEDKRLYKEQKWKGLVESKALLENIGVESLIIAGPTHPLQAVKSTMPYLRLSGNFVIYSEFLHPLVETYEMLYQSGSVVNLRLTETWHRTYQVLPKRTHPVMNMPATSGYILSGIKVQTAEEAPAPETAPGEPPSKKQKLA